MDIDAAMGGPRKLFAVRRAYLKDSRADASVPANLYAFEIQQAERYEVDVARADNFATRAYNLKVEMIELEATAVQAEADARLATTTDVRRVSLLATATTNRQRIAELTPLEREARTQAYALELTRDQPNLAEDTQEAAFESIIWDVNLPGVRSATCDSDRCIADYWTNDIDGPGGLNKLGAGTLALAGKNTYRGGTTVSEGTLQFGLESETGSVSGDIVNNASIIVARSNEWDYKGAISGTGTIDIYGTGTFRLSGNNSYSGTTTAYNGNLAVDGRIVSLTDIVAGGTLSGSGQVGAISAHAAAWLHRVILSERSLQMAMFDLRTARIIMWNIVKT